MNDRPDPQELASTSRAHFPVAWGPFAAFLGIAGLVVAHLAGTATMILLLLVTDFTVDDFPVSFVVASTLVLQGAMLALAFFLGPWRRGFVGSLLGHKRLSSTRLFGWATIAFVTSIGLSAAYVLLAGLISEDLVPEPVPGDFDFAESFWFSFIVIAVIAPFAEEVFFRGFLFAGFARRYGFWIAAIASAAVFAAVHLELARAVPAMLSGLVFAWVYWRSGSVWPGVLAHTGQNTIAFGLSV